MQNTTSTPLRVTSRFDALKSSKSTNTTTHTHTTTHHHGQFTRSKPKPSVQSSSTLFSVGNSSLADYINTKAEDTAEKYVSPAMRWREQKGRTRQNFRRNNFAQDKQNKKPTLDISGEEFPSMNGETKTVHRQSQHNTKYAEAAAMDDEAYDTKQREIAAKTNNNTTYVSTDTLEENPVENYHEEDYHDPQKPVCKYAAATAAMGMLRAYQYKRDEENYVFGAQSKYWGMKSLVDFNIDSDDDSNYAESSEEEDGKEEEQDDY